MHSVYIMVKKNESSAASVHRVFVYGTLKRGFYNHDKVFVREFGGIDLVGHANAQVKLVDAQACTADDCFKLVVGGKYFAPFMFVAESESGGCRVQGELYEVSDEVLLRLDELEGIAYGYYARKRIRVISSAAPDSVIEASVYLKVNPAEELKKLPSLPSYTMAIHEETYICPEKRKEIDELTGFRPDSHEQGKNTMLYQNWAHKLSSSSSR